MSTPLDKLLTFAFGKKASDVILKTNSPPVLRMNGELNALQAPPLTETEIFQFLRAVLTTGQLLDFHKTLELDAAVGVEGVGRMRLNVFQQRRHITAVLRLIPRELPPLADLRLPPVVRDFAMKDRGLVLVTGPAGCGKTTTIAAMVAYRAERDSCNVITVEDPIEYEIPSREALINQREVGRDTLTFAAALRQSLRQDPDVIVIGEMRDLETIQMAITAAETGHLVLSTLHTVDAVRTVDRIIDVFPSFQQRQVRLQLSANLVGVISQLLLKTANGAGLALACEILVATPAVQNLIRESKTYMIASIMQTKADESMRTMNRALLELIQRKIITAEEALAKTPTPDDLEKALGRTALDVALRDGATARG
jgi:twitching motility protein PilT